MTGSGPVGEGPAGGVPEADAAGLVAASGPLGPAFDLLSAYRADGFLFERAGVGVVGAGAAIVRRVIAAAKHEHAHASLD